VNEVLKNVEVSKVYQNKKNKKLYKVEGIGKYTEKPMELVEMVFYRALAIFPEEDGTNYWIRPLELFKEKFEEI
jgi:hypothetical protein